MKIEFHYTYLLVALSFILTGYFSNLLVFTSIILIQELGHYLTARLLHLPSEKIIIYPYGGITKLNIPINTKINKELLVAISGLIFQSIYYLIIIYMYKQNLIREYIYQEFNTYHYSIFFFNILPIYPLDGSKIINLILSKFLPYKLSNKLNIYLSIISLIILLIINYYNFNYTTILIISVILSNIYKYHQELDYLFNKFLLERYLHHYTYKSTKNINKIDYMYKEKYHLIKDKNHYLTEKQVLNHRFNHKYSKNI